MEAKELMIGDWVMIENYSRICAIAEDGVYFADKDGRGATSFDRIKPIPLTPEILEKNGWILNEDTYIKGIVGIWLDDEDETLWIVGTRVRDNMYHSFCDIRYVHQLQNLFRVADESKLGEMEIKD